MAIRLTIKHSTVAKEGAPGTLMRATYHLRDHKEPNFNFHILEPRLQSLTISFLARRWFLVHRSTNERDANEELLAMDSSADAPLSDLLPTGKPNAFEYTSDDPTMIAALDERVKRACAMLSADQMYSEYFRATTEVYFDLSDPQATPSGPALPTVSDESERSSRPNSRWPLGRFSRT